MSFHILHRLVRLGRGLAYTVARPGTSALALAILLASCANPAEHMAGPLTPLSAPEAPAPAATAAARKPPPLKVDLAPLAAAYKARPADPDAALAYARGLRESGSTAQALTILDKTSALKPADKRLLLERGLLALELGEPAKAEALLRKAQDDKAPDWRLHSGLGTALAARGRQQEAQLEYAKALALAPDHPSILNNLALSYALDGKAEEAEQLLRKARQAKGMPEQDRVEQNLALVLGLRGKYVEARTAAAAALTPAKARENTAYLQQLTGPRAASAQADATGKAKPVDDRSNFEAWASLPLPSYNLGGPAPAEK
jgi:Flp pilus assembly protein TadD